ncbi:pseudouridine synthase [uncultured Treponema sp.]|uniref:pseudouridine synthase n=1 Tax=uncultured Treponema sp. TaxID=162155 RepID=UPI002599CCEE|nr:pseudouridine synthase [uncultured Treponema sp.]
MRMRNRGLNLQDNDSKIRLQVFLAHSGVASRRACEKIIESGRVSVNGSVVTELGTKVSAQDEVLVDGKKVFPEETKRYVLLNKPAGYVCTLSEEKGRPVAAELLKEAYSERLYNVGRLDMFSQGLIIFTNDGDFAAALSHPSAEIEKEYIVDTSLPLPRNLAEEFQRGIRVDGIFYKCKSAQEINARRMKIVLIEGKNREIRNVFKSKEIGIKKLTRVRIGSVTIEGLQSGQFRELSQYEVQGLLKLCRSKAI